MVSRRRLLVGSAAALSGLGVAGSAAAGSAPVLPAGAAAGFPLPGGLVCPVPFMSRAAWGANETLRYTNDGGYWAEEWYPVLTLTVHNSGFAVDPDPAQTVRDIYTRQTLYGDGSPGAVGWGDIGYNLLIDAQGIVYEGRYSGSDGMPVFNPDGAMVTGAHVKHYNTGNIGVCLLGYLNDAPATAAAQNSLVTVLAYLAAVGRVNPTGTVNYVNANPAYSTYKNTVRGMSGHRDWASTDCPGNAFYPLLAGLRTRVVAAMPKLPSPTVVPVATPTAGANATPTPPTPGPNSHPSPSKSAAGSRDRGGDEYVALARKASPSAYPTKRTSPTSGASVAPSPAAPASTVPTPSPSAGLVELIATVDPGGSGWGLATTVVGVAAAGGLGALGARWLRQRRSLSTVEPPAESTGATP
jgi:hypothetical protein